MEWTVVIGVDTHRDFHVAVALDRLGRRVDSLRFPVNGPGFASLRRLALRWGTPVFVIEGTGCYGASLARALLASGFPVYECERPRRAERGAKNDFLDAERAARRLLSEQRLALPRLGSERERLRLLLAERRSAQRARTQARNQLQAALVTLAPRKRQQLSALVGERLRRTLARQPELASLRRLALRIELLSKELLEVDAEIAELVQALCPRLLQQHGVGPICAAQLLVSAAQPQRLRSEAAFAALAGVSPIEASSGQQRRHRLNRGGDRQLNWALHMTALTRIRSHPETRNYYQRLVQRGKTKREAIRCVKRVIARRLYRTLIAEATNAPA